MLVSTLLTNERTVFGEVIKGRPILPDHKAALLSRPRLQGALSEQQLELARGEGVQESRVGEVVIILDVVDNLGAQQ